MVGDLVEKVYQAVASELDIAPDLLSFESPARMERVALVALSTLDVTRDDLARSLEARAVALDAGAPHRPRSIVVTRETHRIPETKADEFREKLKALIEEFDSYAVSEAGDDEETHPYAFTVAFYPHFDYQATLMGREICPVMWRASDEPGRAGGVTTTGAGDENFLHHLDRTGDLDCRIGAYGVCVGRLDVRANRSGDSLCPDRALLEFARDPAAPFGLDRRSMEPPMADDLSDSGDALVTLCAVILVAAGRLDVHVSPLLP